MTRRPSPPPAHDERRWQASPVTGHGAGPRGGGRGGRSIGPGAGSSVITPVTVTLAVALVGSIAFMGYAITVRDELQVPLLASGSAVLGLVFTALAVTGAAATLRAGREARAGRALAFAFAGGIAAIVACGALAAALIFGLLWRSGG